LVEDNKKEYIIEKRDELGFSHSDIALELIKNGEAFFVAQSVRRLNGLNNG